MATQQAIEGLKHELDTFPMSEHLQGQELAESARRLERFIDKVARYVDDERAHLDNGAIEDALAAIDEARERLRGTMEGICRAGHDTQGLCVMCYTMAQASIGDALDDLWSVAAAEKVSS